MPQMGRNNLGERQLMKDENIKSEPYIIVNGNNPETLCLQVNELIKRGYQCAGGVAVFVKASNFKFHEVWTQALIKQPEAVK